jgi:Rps23 Pro-64 3,4-dihydroxylase Tpa1-like proline 4-hydroxylase
MPNQENLNLSSAVAQNSPFPHFAATSVLNNNLETKLYDWFQSTGEWNLVETDFYEQYEFSLLNINIPEDLKCLIEPDFLTVIENQFTQSFNLKGFKLVDVVAHKLVNSQHIGVHNDFIDEEETHRMLIQINPHWKEEHGGYLLLFNSADSKDMAKVVSPINNTAFGFEISKKSHHAVSKIYDFTRYTIVYTFKHVSV